MALDALWPLIPGSLYAHVQSLPYPLLTVFASLCPCHDYSLEMFTRDKDWLLTLYLLYSILEGKQEAGCKFLNWSPPISCQRKCKQEGWLVVNVNLEPIYLLPQQNIQLAVQSPLHQDSMLKPTIITCYFASGTPFSLGTAFLRNLMERGSWTFQIVLSPLPIMSS